MTREQKAKAAHDIWAHWMKYFFTQCSPLGENGTLCIPANLEKRWKRLMNTPFEELTEEEQKSDFEVADLFLKE